MYKLSVKLIISLLLLFNLPSMASAAIKCWKNDKGVRECSFTVPKKYSNREIQILNSQGQVIRVIPAEKTPEQKAQDAKLAKIAAEKKRKKEEKRRQDRILLNTYTSTDDMIISRDAKITAIEAIVKISRSNRNKQQKILDKYTQRAGNFERKSQKVPQTILDDINKTKAKIAEIDKFIENKKQEKLAIHQKYDRDMKRFKELKSIRPR